MAKRKQDQNKFDLNGLFIYMQTLQEPTSQMMMHCMQLQLNIQDSRNRFIDSQTRPGFQEKTYVNRETRGSYNDFQNLWKRLNRTLLGDSGGSSPAGTSNNARSRQVCGLWLIKEIEEKMESDASVKRLEQDLRRSITTADGSRGVRVKIEEGVVFSEKNLQKLRAECEEDFKKSRESGKKSLMDCVKECKESDELFKVLNAMKVQVDKVTTELSRLINDFILMISGKEHCQVKIGRFMSKLKGFSTIKIIELPDMEKIEERDLKKLLKIRSPINDLLDKFLEQVQDLLCNKFIVMALYLEYIMSHRLHPESQDSVKVELAAYECGLKQSEEMLKVIGENLNALKEIFSPKPESKDEKKIEDLHLMESMIVQYWSK